MSNCLHSTKSSASKKRVYIDMDGVLCDYRTAYYKKLLANPAIIKPQSQYGFFASLEPMPGAVEAFHLLREQYDVYILTAPSYLNPMCYTEKRVWVEKNLGMWAVQRLIISCNKGLFIGDYLIDDLVHAGFEGEHIHFGTRKFPDWKTVLQYLGVEQMVDK